MKKSLSRAIEHRMKRRTANLTVAGYVRISRQLIDAGALPEDRLDEIMDWPQNERLLQDKSSVMQPER